MPRVDVAEITIALLLFAGMLWGLYNWTHPRPHSSK
jgi:hypothetical protein